MSGNAKAADGNVFVCCACGKTATTAYGFDDNGSTASPGWDESCAMNAQEFAINKLVLSPGGRVVEVLP